MASTVLIDAFTAELPQLPNSQSSTIADLSSTAVPAEESQDPDTALLGCEASGEQEAPESRVEKRKRSVRDWITTVSSPEPFGTNEPSPGYSGSVNGSQASPSPCRKHVRRDQDESAETASIASTTTDVRGNKLFGIRYRLHGWSQEAGELTRVGAKMQTSHAPRFANFWYWAKNKATREREDRIKAILRDRSWPAPRFPGLTEEARMHLYCLSINGDSSKRHLIVDCEEAFEHIMEAAREKKADEDEASRPSVDIILFDESAMLQVLAKFNTNDIEPITLGDQAANIDRQASAAV